MAITKQKGDIAEAYVTYLLKQNGFNVLVPWGEDSRYDIVTEKKGIFKRIQVNYNIIHYSPKDIDIIAAYSPSHNKVYFIPLNGIKNRRVCKLRLIPTKNRQKKFVVMASKYESSFDLLEK
jgi:hypothetical protein